MVISARVGDYLTMTAITGGSGREPNWRLGQKGHEMKHRIALGASKTLALYSFAGWVYIALVALIHPSTLGLQLTHFTSFPHEDTFGELCFAISLVSFFVYSLLRFSKGETAG
jgi:hypothetical protein